METITASLSLFSYVGWVKRVFVLSTISPILGWATIQLSPTTWLRYDSFPFSCDACQIPQFS